MFKLEMIAREEEKKKIEQGLDNLIKGDFSFTLVVGNSGVGKTFLISQVEQLFYENRCTYIKTKFTQYNQDLYSPATEIIDEIVKQLLTLDQESFLLVQKTLKERLKKEENTILTLCPLASRIFGGKANSPTLEGTNADRIVQSMSAFIKEAASVLFPLVIFIDDVHWGDVISTKLVKSLCLRGKASNFYLILALRENINEELDRFVLGKDKIHLHEFLLEDVEKFIKRKWNLQEETLKTLGALLYNLTKGNPFYLEFIARKITEENILLPGEIYCELDMEKFSKMSLLEDIEEILQNEILKISKDELELLQLISSFGNRISQEMLNAFYKDKKYFLDQALKAVSQKSLLLKTQQNHKTLPGTIGGNLTIDAPNATVTNEATVSGTAIINGVSYSSYLAYYPHLGGIRMNGAGRVNLQSAASASPVEINTSSMVLLDGQINHVIIITPNALARVQGTINQIGVNGDAGQATIELLGSSNVSGINATGSAQVYKADGATSPNLIGPATLNDGYMVTFNSNGGDTEAKPTYLLWDNSSETQNRIPYEPTRVDYNFAGWNTLQNGTGNVVGAITTVSAATTVYAKWSASNIEITGYDALASVDGGDIGNPKYENAAAVIGYLQANVTCVAISGHSEVVAIGVWEDTDSYVSNAATSYTFTATVVGPIPAGYEDLIDTISNVPAEIIVSEVQPPQITLVYAQEGRPNEGPFEEGIGEGDTLAISFDKATNQSGTRTKAQVDEMIAFDFHEPALSLGTSYSGTWLESGKKFVIDIHDASGANLTTGYSLTIKSGANILSANGLSEATTASGVIKGSFSPEGLYGLVLKSASGDAPINGVVVKAYSGVTEVGSGTTDVNGAYHVDLDSGDYTLKIYEDYYYLPENKTVSAPSNVQNIYLQEASKITATLNVIGGMPDGYRLIWQMTNFANYDTRNIDGLNLEIPGIPVGADHWLHFTLVNEGGYTHPTSCAAVSLTQTGLLNGATLYPDGNSSYINISNSLSFNNTVDIGTIKLEIKAINE